MRPGLLEGIEVNAKTKSLNRVPEREAVSSSKKSIGGTARLDTNGNSEWLLDHLHLERQALLESSVQLEVSRDRYANLYDSAPIGYVTLNRGGCIRKINPAGAWLLKGSRERLEGMPFIAFVAKADKRKFLHHLWLCRQRKGDQLSTELWLKTDPGQFPTCVELISNAPPWPGSGPPVYHSVLLDITRRKEAEEGQRVAREHLEECVRERTRALTLTNQALEGKISEHLRAERALRESEERWRLMIDGARDHAIFMLDTHGQVMTWNTAAQQVHGHCAEEILGRHVSCFYTTEDLWRKMSDQLLKTAVEQGRAETEGWRLRSDNSRFWANVVVTALREMGGRLRGFLMITRDITERMHAQTALRESEEKLADFFERSPIGLVWAGPDGTIQRINQAWVDMVGHTRAGCLRSHLRDFFFDPRTADELMEQIKRHAVVHDFPARVRSNGGPPRAVLVDADGLWEKARLLHARFFMRDISRRVQLEREILLVAEREQRRIGRDLHDDLCQQLTGIEFLSQTLATELAGDSPAGAERAREIAGLVRQSITRTRELARGLSPVQLETLGLAGALQELSRRSKRLFRIDCAFSCPGPISNHRDDAVSVHLYRIAQEAVGNAVKHGKARSVEIALKCHQDRLILSIKDDGVGISKPTSKRRGMGLRIMQYRADTIGGTLSVQRNRDGGTSVTCTVNETNGQSKPDQNS